MKEFREFVVKEAKHIVRDKRTMLILFVMPVILMLLFGFAIRTDVRDVRVVVVKGSWDHEMQRVVQAVDASAEFAVTGSAPDATSAERMIRNQRADMALVFSPRFASRRFDDISIQLITDGADPNMAQQYQNYVVRIVGETMQQGHGAAATPAVVMRMLYNPRMLSAYNFVPGIMGMLLMLICAMMTSVSIVREKERGTMEVLLVSPVRPLMIIVAKAVPYLVLALLILTVILLMAFFVLGVPLQGSIVWIVVVSLLYILLSLSIGLLISNAAQSQLVALLFSAMVLLMPTLLLSGMIFPVESMPAVLRWLSTVVPARWYISAMRKLMIMGVGIADVVQEVVILLIMTVLLLMVSLKKFKERLE